MMLAVFSALLVSPNGRKTPPRVEYTPAGELSTLLEDIS